MNQYLTRMAGNIFFVLGKVTMQTGIIYITITCPVAVEKSCRKHNAGKHLSSLAECEQSLRGRAGSARLL